MIKFLFLLIVAVFFYYVFKIGFSVIRMFLGALFGVQPASRSTSSNQNKTKQTTKQSNKAPSKKIISRDEGEYVDFEEVKD